MLSDIIQYAIGFAGFSYFENYENENIISKDRDPILVMINLCLLYYCMLVIKSETFKYTKDWPIEYKDSIEVLQKIIYGTIEPLVFIIFAQTLKSFLNSTSGPFFIVFCSVSIFKLVVNLDSDV